jgi:hypothetical protein
MPLRTQGIERVRVGPGQEAFSSFFERNALRDRRRRGRRLTLIVSLAVHGFVLLAVVLYSMWQVEELWGPSVRVKMFSPAAAPVTAPPAPRPPR